MNLAGLWPSTWTFTTTGGDISRWITRRPLPCTTDSRPHLTAKGLTRLRRCHQATTRRGASGELQKELQFTTCPPPRLRRRRRFPSRLERSRFYLNQALFRVLTNRSTLKLTMQPVLGLFGHLTTSA